MHFRSPQIAPPPVDVYTTIPLAGIIGRHAKQGVVCSADPHVYTLTTDGGATLHNCNLIWSYGDNSGQLRVNNQFVAKEKHGSEIEAATSKQEVYGRAVLAPWQVKITDVSVSCVRCYWSNDSVCILLGGLLIRLIALFDVAAAINNLIESTSATHLWPHVLLNRG